MSDSSDKAFTEILSATQGEEDQKSNALKEDKVDSSKDTIAEGRVDGSTSTDTGATTTSDSVDKSQAPETTTSDTLPTSNRSSPPSRAGSPRSEIVHLHIVKLLQHNPTPGAPPFEVLDVVEGPPVPFLETVRAYPNQVLPATSSPAEREVALRQLKISAWNNFVESMTPPAGVATGGAPVASHTDTATSPKPNSTTAVKSTSPIASKDSPLPDAPAPLSRSNSDLQFPSAVPPPAAANAHIAAPQPQQQTPFQQLYTDHYLQQQQAQQQAQQQQQRELQLAQMQQKQSQKAQEPSAGAVTKAPFADIDVNYAYWQQKQAQGGESDDLTLTTFPQDLLDRAGQSKSKSSKDSGASRAHKSGQKSNAQKDKVKKEKVSGESAGLAGKSQTANVVGKAGASNSANKKRKSTEEMNPKKASAASKAQKLARSMLNAGSHGVDMSALAPQQAGVGMAKVSGAGTMVPNDASWFPYPPNLDRAVNLFSDRVLAWDQDKSGKKSPKFNDYRQMITAMNAESAAKKKLEKKTTQAAVTLNSASDTGLLLPSADDIVSSSKSKGKDKSKDKDGKDVQEEWVQCDSCARWRTLPPPGDPLYPHDLPDQWTCAMNTWHPDKASCSVPEDTASQQSGALRAKKIRIWVRRLRSGDKYEAKHKSSNHYSEPRDKDNGKGGKRFGEVDWIRCSSPFCGKWRACLRSSNAQKIRNENKLWFCWMNSWDEARSSCNAPQEGTAVHNLGAPYVMGDKATEDDDDVSMDDGQDDDSSDRGGDSAVVQGISSRGRVVRSRWNSRRARK